MESERVTTLLQEINAGGERAFETALVHEAYLRSIQGETRLRHFAGCSLLEIPELTGRSLATVRRDWTYGRAWLYDFMAA